MKNSHFLTANRGAFGLQNIFFWYISFFYSDILNCQQIAHTKEHKQQITLVLLDMYYPGLISTRPKQTVTRKDVLIMSKLFSIIATDKTPAVDPAQKITIATNNDLTPRTNQTLPVINDNTLTPNARCETTNNNQPPIIVQSLNISTHPLSTKNDLTPQPTPKISIFAKIWAYFFGSKPSSSPEKSRSFEENHSPSFVKNPIQQTGWFMWLKSLFGF